MKKEHNNIKIPNILIPKEGLKNAKKRRKTLAKYVNQQSTPPSQMQ